MFSYTYNNHFRYGYAIDDDLNLNLNFNQWFRPRRFSEEKFVASYGKASLRKSSLMSLPWRESNLLAAREIQKRSPSPLWILFSGGTDSEACVRTFQEAGISFRIVSLRFAHGLNSHDFDYVLRYARASQIPVEVIDLDVEEFLESNLFYSIVDPIQCVSPILAIHLWLADQLDGTPIIAQGEPHFIKKVAEDYIPGKSIYGSESWFLVESERLCTLYTHFILKKRAAIPGFFQYLPEQFVSFYFHNPLLQKLISNQMEGKLGTRSSKNQMVRQFYPEILPRPKYTGFEKLEHLHEVKRRELARRFPHSDEVFYFSLKDLLTQLLPISLRCKAALAPVITSGS